MKKKGIALVGWLWGWMMQGQRPLRWPYRMVVALWMVWGWWQAAARASAKLFWLVPWLIQSRQRFWRMAQRVGQITARGWRTGQRFKQYLSR